MPLPLRLCCPALLLAAICCLNAPAQTAPSISPAIVPAVAPIAQPVAPLAIDQKTLLASARHAYYLPLERGVQGFSCAVAIDWQPILERATGKRVPDHDPTLTQLASAKVAVTDDLLKGATVTSTFPDAKFQPLPSSSVGVKQKILDTMISASLTGWNPFLTDRILPMEATRYHFEHAGAGYRLSLEGGSFFSILDLTADLRITHGESHLNGTVTDFTPQFDPSSHGWLLTSLETITEPDPSSSASSAAAPTSGPDKAGFTYSYQFVGDMLVPKRIIVQVGDGPPTPFELRDCTLTRTNQAQP
ncbi:MAG TPA: hypothetical protein VNW54_09465 [Granulicella sp.]|jgi:hypothetical protein|nr:hypothetical protein [Granulicella sp.]